MTTWKVEIGVALRRPPRIDRTTFIELSQEYDAHEVELIAIAMATGRRDVVTAVSSVITDWPG